MSRRNLNKARGLFLTILFIAVITTVQGKSLGVEEPEILKNDDYSRRMVGGEYLVPINSEKVKTYVEQGLEKYSATHEGQVTFKLEKILSASTEIKNDILHNVKIRILVDDNTREECNITVREFNRDDRFEKVTIDCDEHV